MVAADGAGVTGAVATSVGEGSAVVSIAVVSAAVVSAAVVSDSAADEASPLVVDTASGPSTLADVDGVAGSDGDGVVLRPQAAAAVDTPVP